MEIIRKHQQKTTEWSGGLTTELFIYPKGSSYKDRDFKFRLSTATVEVDTSVFTPLAGITRTLMVLDGEMSLFHEGHHSSNLGPLQKDNFQGGWNTSSKGRCVDFNLMCMNGASGDLDGLEIKERQITELNIKGEMNFIYLYQGEAKVDDEVVGSGDLIMLGTSDSCITVESLTDCRVVQIEVTI